MAWRLIEDERLSDKDWLTHQYCVLNKTYVEIGRECGVAANTVRKRCWDYDIKPRLACPRRKLLGPELLTEDGDLAYLLGFLLADGYVNRTGTHVVQLATDRDVIDQFVARFGGTCWTGTTPKGKPVIHWDLYSQSFAEYLVERYGFKMGRKTFSLPNPPPLPKELYAHFARGFFDGDGSVYLEEKKYLMVSIGSSDGRFLERLAELFPRQPKRWSQRSPSGKPFYQLVSRGGDAVTNCEWMYCGGQGIHSKTKWQRYECLKALAKL